jgi:hypothetical protein
MESELHYRTCKRFGVHAAETEARLNVNSMPEKTLEPSAVSGTWMNADKKKR